METTDKESQKRETVVHNGVPVTFDRELRAAGTRGGGGGGGGGGRRGGREFQQVREDDLSPVAAVGDETQV